MSEKKDDEQSKMEEEHGVPDFEAKWKRAVADYRNLEARVVREREELARFSNFVLILNLLPVLDDLEEAAKESADDGVAQILKKFRGILAEAGLEEVAAAGKEFDPNVMEGLPAEEKSQTLGTSSESDSGESAGQKVVAEMVRKGYTLNGRLLRPARVKVGKI